MGVGFGVLILTTPGFRSLPEELQGYIMEIGLKRIRPGKPDWVVFDPNADKSQYEDDGRTLRISTRELAEMTLNPVWKRLDKKVYCILDDYGSPEMLSQCAGFKVNTRYAVTFLLAEEY